MKHTLLSFLILLFFTALHAQDGNQAPISLSRTSLDTVFLVDLSDSDLDLDLNTLITNKTNETLKLKWVRTVKEKPESWQTYVCIDNFLCYFPSNSTNFDPANDVEEPLELVAGATMDFALHILPQQVMGNGSFELSLALISNPDSVIAKIEFKASVRDQITSTRAVVSSDIRVFPNPATEYIMLTDYSQISRVDVYSMLGRRMRSFPVMDDRSMSLVGLPGGLYLVSLVDYKGRVVKTLRLSKQSLRP